MPFDFDAALLAPLGMQSDVRRMAEGTDCLSPVQPGDVHCAPTRAAHR
jgi:hypothetical protein